MIFDAKDLQQFEEFVGVIKTQVELQNSKGQKMIMDLEPLKSTYFGKIIYVQERMPRRRIINPREHKAGRPALYESEETMLSRLKEEDYDVWSNLLDLLKLWITQSYKDIPAPALNKLLLSQMPRFINAFMHLHSDVDDETGAEKELKDFIAEKREILNEKAPSSETDKVGV